MTSEKLLYIFTALFLDGLAGLSGGLLPMHFVRRHITTLLAFAAGTLIGAAFLDLLPTALAGDTPPTATLAWCLSGFLVFYVIEVLVGSHAAGQTGHQHGTIGPMILVGDALHNTTDGVAIAAAFQLDLRVGIATAVAVFVHELPQEIGDYAILISNGYSRGRALFFLCLVQLSAVLGAIGTLWATAATIATTRILVAISAGGFIYIASADLLPELRRQSTGTPIVKVLAFCSGIAVIATLQVFIK